MGLLLAQNHVCNQRRHAQLSHERRYLPVITSSKQETLVRPITAYRGSSFPATHQLDVCARVCAAASTYTWSPTPAPTVSQHRSLPPPLPLLLLLMPWITQQRHGGWRYHRQNSRCQPSTAAAATAAAGPAPAVGPAPAAVVAPAAARPPASSSSPSPLQQLRPSWAPGTRPHPCSPPQGPCSRPARPTACCLP